MFYVQFVFLILSSLLFGLFAFDATKYTKSKWLHGSDLALGMVYPATVKNAYEHTFDDGTTRPVLDFYELDQSLSMNKSQTKTMVELFGANADAWIGQRVELMATPSNFQGKPTILIRKAAQSGPTINGQPVVTQPTPPAMPSPQWTGDLSTQPTPPAAAAPTMPAANDPAALWGNTAAPATPTVTGGGVTFQGS